LVWGCDVNSEVFIIFCFLIVDSLPWLVWGCDVNSEVQGLIHHAIGIWAWNNLAEDGYDHLCIYSC